MTAVSNHVGLRTVVSLQCRYWPGVQPAWTVHLDLGMHILLLGSGGVGQSSMVNFPRVFVTNRPDKRRQICLVDCILLY